MKKSLFVSASVIVALGLLNSCDKDKTGEAGSKIGKTLTEFTSGVGEGVDEHMVVEVENIGWPD